MSVPFLEENDQTRARQEHLESLRQLVGNAYPNKFERSQIVEPGREDTITAIVEKFRAFEPQAVDGSRPAAEAIDLANQQLNNVTVRLAGRIASPPRVMGKAAFVHLSDGKQRLQVYIRQADATGIRNDTAGGDVDGWGLFNLLDHGDFIGVEGYLFITKTGELSIHVQKLQFLAKALLPLPDKMHGLHDPEIRQRQRYADLIAGSLKLEREDGELTPREVFERRSTITREMRRILEDHGYIEVETPMLTSKATGAAARPFKTHHNALDIDLYARIAPELYLKRLLVGGFEKVYELNRNFRNEGIDRTHNPEFTMLEFYWAYANATQMMDFCEELLRAVVFKVLGHTHVKYGEYDIDFSRPFQRMTMKEAIIKNVDSMLFLQNLDERIDELWLDEHSNAANLLTFLNWVLTKQWAELASPYQPANSQLINTWRSNWVNTWQDIKASPAQIYTTNFDQVIAELSELSGEVYQRLASLLRRSEEQEAAKQQESVFRHLVKPYLAQPTFVRDYPKSISPLSKVSPKDPNIAERFEFFIAGMECANGFSELNDPTEQYQRFQEQVSQRERGDEEAMVMDEDYIRALSYGMPPAAGIGIGVDRFVMLLTNQQSIRDVILFPHMRPERKVGEAESGGAE